MIQSSEVLKKYSVENGENKGRRKSENTENFID